MVTIGRLPDNDIVIENPAVSGHHACVFRDGDRFAIEDLGSRNGTFVNERRVTRHTLTHGDVVLVGKHILQFDEHAAAAPEPARQSEATLSPLGDTVYLDTDRHRALLDKLGGDPQSPVQTALGAAATLRVVQGRTEQAEYLLSARTSFIGKSDTALVRLRGWFSPRMAVAIARDKDGYVATALNGKATINGEPLAARQRLNDGDVLRCRGLALEFRAAPSTSPA